MQENESTLCALIGPSKKLYLVAPFSGHKLVAGGGLQLEREKEREKERDIINSFS